MKKTVIVVGKQNAGKSTTIREFAKLVETHGKLKFLDQCREVMRFKQLSRRTEETYL